MRSRASNRAAGVGKVAQSSRTAMSTSLSRWARPAATLPKRYGPRRAEPDGVYDRALDRGEVHFGMIVAGRRHLLHLVFGAPAPRGFIPYPGIPEATRPRDSGARAAFRERPSGDEGRSSHP
jgi:hypothetical protein